MRDVDHKEIDELQLYVGNEDMDRLHLENITYRNLHDVEDLLLTEKQKDYLPDIISSLVLEGIIREDGITAPSQTYSNS